MRQLLDFLPIILITLSVPAFAVPPESPKPDAMHIIQIIRSGKGQPRVRDASLARTAALRTVDPAEGMGQTRPYQEPKPGEGAPKN